MEDWRWSGRSEKLAMAESVVLAEVLLKVVPGVLRSVQALALMLV
jgi:hypothetical protein